MRSRDGLLRCPRGWAGSAPPSSRKNRAVAAENGAAPTSLEEEKKRAVAAVMVARQNVSGEPCHQAPAVHPPARGGCPASRTVRRPDGLFDAKTRAAARNLCAQTGRQWRNPRFQFQLQGFWPMARIGRLVSASASGCWARLVHTAASHAGIHYRSVRGP